jgi:hypothetical protein
LDNLTKIEDQLFFIVGCGRSGTTLLKTILNAHPEVSIPHETFFFNDIAQGLPDGGNDDDLEKKLNLILSKWWIRTMGVDKEQLRKNLGARNPSWRNLFLSLLESASSHASPKYFGEKTVANIRFAEQLLEMYPKCRVVQIIRDPRAAFLSFKKAKVGTIHVAPLIRDWKFATSVDQSLKDHPRYQSIKFECLIRDTQPTMEKVCCGLEIPFHPQMMKFYERNDKGFSTVQNHHENTMKPIFSSGLDKWKTELSQSQTGMIEHFLGEPMAEYGYEPTGNRVNWPDSRMYFSWWADAVAKWCIRRPRAQMKKLVALRKLRTATGK